MARTCQQALAELGVSGAGHAATQFNDQVASPAELILTAEERQRDAVTRLVPGAIRRTFALKEFVRLGHQMPAGRDFEPLPERVARVAELRGKVPAAAPGADDIADPYGRPLRVARECAAEISKAVDELAALLG